MVTREHFINIKIYLMGQPGGKAKAQKDSCPTVFSMAPPMRWSNLVRRKEQAEAFSSVHFSPFRLLCECNKCRAATA